MRLGVVKDFSFKEREAGVTPWLKRIHCFNYDSKMSLGNLSGDIPAVSEGAAKFYPEDIEQHWRGLQDYDTPELHGDEWTPGFQAFCDSDHQRTDQLPHEPTDQTQN